jgi:NurA-like 5'-3' nuclease
MADKLTFVRLFNQKAEEFCKDLVLTFPEVNEFKQLKSGMLLMKNLDEKKPREVFSTFMTQQFRESIMGRHDSFFMNEAHEHIVQIDGLDNSQWENVINLLRSLWVTLSDDNKDVIWKYFQVLIAVSDKCCV